MNRVIKPQSGTAFFLEQGQKLRVIDPRGQQVSDMVLFNRRNTAEKISAGKTFDFEETILLSRGNCLWSNFSRIMAEIEEDTCGRNDFLLAPCSPETFEIIYEFEGYHPSCFENLARALEPYGVNSHEIPTAFNIFMNVQFEPDGRLVVKAPLSQPNDYLTIRARFDLIVGLTACSAENSNNGSFKPIEYTIEQS